MTTLWVDATAGASGDMLLGALIGAGVPLEVIAAAVDAVSPEPVELSVEQVTRGGLAATRCHVDVADSSQHRTWRDVRALLAALPEDLRAAAVFERLAQAEAAVHGISPDDVHFHEVGALDAIADVVGVCAAIAHLAAERIVVSPVAVGSGTVRGAHGLLPVPPPAVARLLTGVPSLAGPAGFEACTPTAAALLTTLASEHGAQPAMTVRAVGVGAGGRDPEGHANVVRLLVGDTDAVAGRAASAGERVETELVVEANVDDLDPRAWPAVLEALLAAGANDAWLSPILMKKGRPAYTLHVLVAPAHAAAVRREIFRQTTTIGVREHEVAKTALEREFAAVVVDGQQIAVKVARLAGVTVNAQPEWEDVSRAAAALGRPVADVLAAAQAAYRNQDR
jgi:pyridinium-3,5-bisthiocarboxylic acid mononucleotide nickel chelatase